jgi:hypothetical protein
MTTKQDIQNRVEELEANTDDGCVDNLAEAIQQAKRKRRDDADENAHTGGEL